MLSIGTQRTLRVLKPVRQRHADVPLDGARTALRNDDLNAFGGHLTNDLGSQHARHGGLHCGLNEALGGLRRSSGVQLTDVANII